jgi:predicted DNA-binding transcriptional regulator YafY
VRLASLRSAERHLHRRSRLPADQGGPQPGALPTELPLHAPADEIADRVPSYWGTVEEIDARSCEYRTGDDDLGWLAVRIAMLGVEFEVHEPPELAEHLGALADRLRRATVQANR